METVPIPQNPSLHSEGSRSPAVSQQGNPSFFLQTYIQRLELTLFCFTFLEIFLSGSTAITAYRMKRLQAEVRPSCGQNPPGMETH